MPRGELLEATASADTHLPPPDIKIITLATSPYRTGHDRNHFIRRPICFGLGALDTRMLHYLLPSLVRGESKLNG